MRRFRVKYIQFKLLYNRIVTNHRLHTMNLSDDNMDSFCDASPETIYHAFNNCPKVWSIAQNRSMVAWKKNNNVKVFDIEWVFGGDKTKSIEGKVILATKRLFNINAEKREFYRQQNMEEYNAEIVNNVEFYANMSWCMWGVKRHIQLVPFPMMYIVK